MARILVADDDAQQLALQQRLLEALGHHVELALSASDALRHVARASADLIVADLRFPTAAEGLALIRGIRQAGCQLPLIVLSGWPDDLDGVPEERMVSRIVMKGNVRELLRNIAELLATSASEPAQSHPSISP